MTVTFTNVRPKHFDWGAKRGPAADVRRILAAATAGDGRSPLDEAALLELADGLSGRFLLLGKPHEDEPAAGFAFVHGQPGHRQLELVVAPEARGRRVGRVLVGAAEATLEEAGEELCLTAWSHGNHPAAAALARRGYRPVRELWLMRRPLDSVPEVPVPEGFAVRAFRPGDDDEAFLALNAEAFAWHPEQGRLDQAGLDERKALEWFDPAGFLLAERGTALAGFHWTKIHHGRVGEVYVIGVAPSAQGTGLGRALLAAGLRHLAGRGLSEAVLYVEADNTPAVRLYEREGFTHAAADTDVMYARG